MKESLTPAFSFSIFMDNYFTSFSLLTHLGINNIQVKGVVNKKLEMHWEQTTAKKGTWLL